MTGPHTPYALPGRMLISFLGGKDGGLPAGLAEFTNDGKFIRKLDLPEDAPYGYDVAIKPDLNRMVTSSFTPLRQLQEAAGQDGPEGLRQRAARLGLPRAQAAAEADDRRRAAGVPLVAQGGRQPRLHQLRPGQLDLGLGGRQQDGNYTTRKLCDTGKLPADLRQSPDDRYLFVSCFGDRRDPAVGRQRPEEARSCTARSSRACSRT